MDWRENGEQLTHLFGLAAAGMLANVNSELLHALINLRKDPAGLVRYLQSRQDIGPIEREIVAASIERMAQGKKSGRPPDPITQALVWAACSFKNAWVYSNAKQGISDHGHRREMGDRTATYVVKAVCSMIGMEWSEELIETVRSRMDKASSRQGLPNQAQNMLERLTDFTPKPPSKL